MWQDIAVCLIVAAALLALLWRYLPQRWRAQVARVHPALAAAQKAQSSSGCGGCSGCAGSSACASGRKSSS